MSSYPMASGSTAIQLRANNTATSITTVTGPLTMWAQPIWIEYRQQDFPTTGTSVSPNTSPTASLLSTSPPHYRRGDLITHLYRDHEYRQPFNGRQSRHRGGRSDWRVTHLSRHYAAVLPKTENGNKAACAARICRKGSLGTKRTRWFRSL